MDRPSDQLAALNVRIATLMGWTIIDAGKRDGLPIGRMPTDAPDAIRAVPDFTGSLDAIHGACEQILITRELATRFHNVLSNVDLVHHSQYVCRAEAWQRAIALDRTLSKEPIL